jgi:hypothetical protein
MFEQLLPNKNKIATVLHSAAQWFGDLRIGDLNKAWVSTWDDFVFSVKHKAEFPICDTYVTSIEIQPRNDKFPAKLQSETISRHSPFLLNFPWDLQTSPVGCCAALCHLV